MEVSSKKKYYLAQCLRCGHTWYSRSEVLKPTCPSCFSHKTVKVRELSVS